MSVSGGATREATIPELVSDTTYSIEVAAVNNAGFGLYSVQFAIETTSSEYT